MELPRRLGRARLGLLVGVTPGWLAADGLVAEGLTAAETGLAGGVAAPAEGEAIPAGGVTTPAGGVAAPAGGEAIPADGSLPAWAAPVGPGAGPGPAWAARKGSTPALVFHA